MIRARWRVGVIERFLTKWDKSGHPRLRGNPDQNCSDDDDLSVDFIHKCKGLNHFE